MNIFIPKKSKILLKFVFFTENDFKCVIRQNKKHSIGDIQVLRNAIFLEIGPPHPPPRNANNIEHYTSVTLFSRKSDTPPHPQLRYVTLECFLIYNNMSSMCGQLFTAFVLMVLCTLMDECPKISKMAAISMETNCRELFSSITVHTDNNK